MLLQSKYNDVRNSDGSVDLDMDLRNYETTKHAFLLQLHEKKRQAAFEETFENAKQKKVGEIYVSGQEKALSYLKEAKEYKEKTNSESCGRGGGGGGGGEENETKKTVHFPNNSESSFVSCKKVPREFELRMQKFAAFSIIPDYEHQSKIDARVGEWEQEFENYFIAKRNAAFSDALKNNPIVSADDTICTCKENEDALWKQLNVEKPHRALVFQDWIKNNALPDFNGAEPAISFLKSSESEEELQSWIENEYQNGNVDIACVSMYEWIRVQDTWNEQVHRTFRHPMINKLHQNKLLQKKEAKKIEGTVKEIEINA
jgi:hypothetical protein